MFFWYIKCLSSTQCAYSNGTSLGQRRKMCGFCVLERLIEKARARERWPLRGALVLTSALVRGPSLSQKAKHSEALSGSRCPFSSTVHIEKFFPNREIISLHGSVPFITTSTMFPRLRIALRDALGSVFWLSSSVVLGGFAFAYQVRALTCPPCGGGAAFPRA